jgi:hypothetical protein
MIFSFDSPSAAALIRKGTLKSVTRVTSKREPVIGDCVQLYYRNNHQNIIEVKNKTRVVCTACLNSQAVTGRKCPYYDPDTYSYDVRCPQFQNFIGYGKVTNVINYENFEDIRDKSGWAICNGFSSVDEARDYCQKLIGVSWESYSLTIISWDYIGKTEFSRWQA